MKQKFIIITAPSGAGKTSVLRGVLKNIDSLGFCVSATNRPKRSNEIHGGHYYFYSTETFKRMIELNELLEWEEVYPGRFYGTPRAELSRLQEQGKHVVFDLEVVGATNLKKRYPDNCITIFIKPPSLDILIERLKNRNTETPESLKARISRMKMELEQADSFDFQVLNEDLDKAILEATSIIQRYIKE